MSGFHLWRNDPERRAADISRGEIIQPMRTASLTSDADHVLSAATWAILLVLLVGELILGGDHSIFLLRMMCSIQTSGVCGENSDLFEFLHRQTDGITRTGGFLSSLSYPSYCQRPQNSHAEPAPRQDPASENYGMG